MSHVNLLIFIPAVLQEHKTRRLSKVVHRHGTCSPLHSRRAALSPVEIMHRDRDKAASIHCKIIGASMINAARTSKVVHLPEC
jgi:hypothetical protein